MPSAPRSTQCVDLVGKLDVAVEVDVHAVGGHGGQIAEGLQADGRRAVLFHLVAIVGQRFFVGLEDHQALVAVDDHQFPAGDVGQEGSGADDGGDFQGLGDDRRMAARAADLGDEAEDEAAVEIGGFAGREVVGQHEHRRGEVGDAFAAAAQQVPQEPLLDIEDVGGPLGQVGAFQPLEDLGIAPQACG